VTYTYRVPHYVVNRVPLDPCGNPISTVVPSTSGEVLRKEPTAPSKSDDATQKPSLPSTFGPVDERVNTNKPTEAPPAVEGSSTPKSSTDGAPTK
jgi:hypothetical protein